MKEKFYMDELYESNKYFKEGYLSIIDTHLNTKKKIRVQTPYGVCLVNKYNLLKGQKPSITTAINKTEYFINQLGEKSYEVIGEYRGSKKKILLIASNGILCSMRPNDLLEGCEPNIDSALDKSEYFSQEAHLTQSFKDYDYSKVNYINNETKVVITCSEHGDFEQTPHSHLQGSGCPICNKTSSFTLDQWLNVKPGHKGLLYIIKCHNGRKGGNYEEEFYKVGITCRNVKERFNSESKMPYYYDVVYLKESYNRENLWYLENDIKHQLRINHYIPKQKFHGCFTECFSSIDPIKHIIND